jgi:hypothetical protein
MSAARRIAGWARARPGVLAIVALGIAWGTTMHSMGWAQLAHFAEVRALADGEKTIDRWHWETGDVAWIDGHYYSVKSPGTAALSVPLYLAIDAGARGAANAAAKNASEAYHPRWTPNEQFPYRQYGYSEERALRVETQIEANTPVVWALTLVAAVIPAVLLLLMVRSIGDRLEPGYGTAAAITLGLGTILMVFAAEFFSHAVAATLAFAAFAVLMRERAGPPRLALVAIAGLLAGLAITFEYQVGLVGVVLCAYAAWRSSPVKRGLAYAAGGLVGALPVFAYNWWTLGSPLRFAYGDAVAVRGASGHQEIGLNDDGFFGITFPRPDAAVDLLLGGRGLLVLTPVLVLAAVGVVLMHRRGHRAEALTIAGVSATYFLYDSAYWQPYGGGTPGPRFLIPMLPFIALGLAFAYRRLPATTLALAIPSALCMLVASLTYPLIGEQGTGLWVDWVADGRFEHTLATSFGVHPNWLAAIPVLLFVALAAGLAFAATPRTAVLDRDLKTAVAALGGWAVAAVLGPSLTADPVTPLEDPTALWLVGSGAAASGAALALLRYRAPRGETEPATGVRGPLAFGDRTS